MTFHRVHVAPELVADWGVHISLLPEAKARLATVAGPLRDYRFWTFGPDADTTDNWGWYLNYGSGAFKKQVILWFRNPAHAAYFKLLWGGR